VGLVCEYIYIRIHSWGTLILYHDASILCSSCRFLSAQSELKLVLCVRVDLKMSPGKIAAQCVHAALAACRILGRTDSNTLAIWEASGEKTVCLKCTSEDQMNDLYDTARAIGLPAAIIRDAGRTEVEPGSKTVLAVGPAFSSNIDAITGHLKLF
jgi:peptidyl-tRNA hydrolase, PTH2 family